MKSCTFCCAIIVACGLLRAADDSTSELPLGIVADKPETGRFVEVDRRFMVPYATTLPGSDVAIEMVPVPGGVFTFGSSPGDADRGEFELDAVEVRLPPFWIAKYETTWAEYWQYMKLIDDFAKFESIATSLKSDKPKLAHAAKQIVANLPAIAATLDEQVTLVDGITAPTPLYDPSTTYEHGEDPQLPAATMTPYAAKQYTEWLSKVTGQQYRLPTEAEWEYVARAGSTTSYPTGDQVETLDDYAWYDENSDFATQKVGQKKPNAWGIHDMIGNVAEWVIDEYDDEPAQATGQVLTWEQAIRWPSSEEGRIARGGFYDSVAEDVRSTSRLYSEDGDWKIEDPNQPKSPWWYTEYPSTGVGFRVVRSLDPLPGHVIAKFWEFNSPEMEEDVTKRVDGGRGKLGPANPTLPKAQGELEDELVTNLLEGKN